MRYRMIGVDDVVGTLLEAELRGGIVPLAEDICQWVVSTFPTNDAYQEWFDRQPPRIGHALGWAAGVVQRIDENWPIGAVEIAYQETEARRELEWVYDYLTTPDRNTT